MPKGSKPRHFRDTYVIYFSRDDKCWIAHSLRTDEFGTGDSIITALADGMKAVDQCIELVKQNPKIELFAEAPQEIQAMARRAQNLPKEMYEIAHKKLYGKWPEDLTPAFKPNKNSIFKRTIMEAVPA